MTIEMKRIVITGGAGFIGSTLAGRLTDQNEIVLFGNLARNTLQHTSFGEHRNVTLVQGDILDCEATRRTVEGPHIVVHAAAIAGIDTVIKSPVRTMEVNMIGTANVLRAATDVKVQDCAIEFSTSEVFGSMVPPLLDVTEILKTDALSVLKLSNEFRIEGRNWAVPNAHTLPGT